MGKKSLLALLNESRKRLHACGFNLWGITAITDFDSFQCRDGRFDEAGAGSAVVIGSGGRALWEHMEEQGHLNGQSAQRGYDPIDTYSELVLLREIEHFRRHGHEACAIFPFDRNPVNFTKLAEAAGIGVISPVIPFLLHPAYGPWISLRGALIFDVEIPSHGDLQDFGPCSECAAPCLDACPVAVYGRDGETHLDRCAGHRHAGGCSSGCDVRRACPVGSEHRYGSDEERFRHAYSLPLLERHYGLGWWRFLPSRIRRWV